jgi:hypothetical protein
MEENRNYEYGGSRSASFDEAVIVREMIRHENELINHRITWLMAFNGLLFTALGIASPSHDNRWIVWILCGLGVIISISSFLGIYDGAIAIRNVRKWWDDHVSKDYTGPDVMALRGENTSFRLLKPWRLMPWVFVLSWILVAFLYAKKSG